MATTDVENWPGAAIGLQGPMLMTQLEEHARRFEAELLQDQIVAELNDPRQSRGLIG